MKNDRDKIEEIIREIATKHGIAVARDDPILILQTINNHLLADSAKAQQVMLDHYKEELEGLALRWGTDAREKAERILNAALAASKDAMARSVEESSKSTAATVGAEIDSALARVAAQARNVRNTAILNVAAAVITMAASATALWAVLH